jgi:ABC-type branched-subunit amino acid transport system substrate-binding protein
LKRRHLLQLGATASAGLAFPAIAQQRKIVLGQSAPFSGPASALGTQLKEGAELVFNQVNARGGVNGRTIELRSVDDGYEPQRCAENTRKLLADEVFSLFGYVGTPTSLAALPLAAAARTPFFAPFSGAEALRVPFNRYAFHVRASYFDETAEIVKQLTAVGIKRIAVFYQNDSYGQTGLDGVNHALKSHGLKAVSLGTVERNTVAVETAVKEILAGTPEAIVQVSAYKSCAAFVRAARKAGFTGGFYNLSFVGTQALANELGADARGVVISQVMPLPFSATSPLAGEYLAAGKSLGAKFEPNYGGIEGYVAARVFVEGLKRAGANPTPDSMVGALESLNNLNLGGHFIDFGPNKHTGSRYVDLTVLTADGRVRR